MRATKEAVRSYDISEVQCLLHLNDTQEAQETDSFRRDWNGFLRAMNVLQFLPKACFVTESGLEDNAYDELKSATMDDRTDWLNAQDMVDTEGRELLNRIAGSTMPVPEVGFELVNDSNIVVAQAEIAWPENRLALFASHDNEPQNRKEFDSAGWTVHLLHEARLPT